MPSVAKTLDLVHTALNREGISHVLIGAFALAALGVSRATNDIDFLVDGSQAAKLKTLMATLGFRVFHESSEVLQFEGPMPVDFLLANRPLSKAMLAQTHKP